MLASDIYVKELDEKCYMDAHLLLGETPKLRNDLIQGIQEWLGENPKINGDPNPKVVLCFLRGCKFNLDKTKKKIKW